MEGNAFFDDLMQGLHEIEEHQRGNIQLKTTTVEVDDDEITFYGMYKNLSESDKIKAMNYVSRLMQA